MYEYIQFIVVNKMDYRTNRNNLLKTLRMWNSFLHRKIHLIACGGTALTLLNIKESTKDIDFIVPIESEHDYLIKILKDLGYSQKSSSGWSRDDVYVFDLFKGNKVHTTNLLEPPLQEGNNIYISEFTNIYLGVLNYSDIIITKLFRSSGVDIEDCLKLMKHKKNEINIIQLKERYIETARYDVSEDKVITNLETFIDLLEK